jgi:hemerythrin-like domain-containing protein
MQRSDALAPLSREHHVALEVALRLRRASADTAEEALGRFEAFWSEHGQRHFAAEEELVLGALPEGDAALAAAAQRLEREHARLRRQAACVKAGDVEALNELGDLLRDHVRFEERELFPLVEDALSPDALDALGRALTR